MSGVVEAAVSAMVLFGAVFVLIGSYGLVRLPNLLTRLHAPTKATTLGMGAILVGSATFFSAEGALSVRELLILFFLFLTAPIGGLMVAKAWMWNRRNAAGREAADLPEPPAPTTDWATFVGRTEGPVDREAETR